MSSYQETRYDTKSTEYFDKWYDGLKDPIAKRAVNKRLTRVAVGLFGDSKRIGKISELRIDVGQGYRVYFTLIKGQVVFLLVGGDKRTQQADIKLATKLSEKLGAEE